MTGTPDQATLAYERQQGLDSLIYFSREFFGFKTSKLEWINEFGKKQKEIRGGPEYGISRLGDHLKMAALLESPGQAKLLSASRDSYKSSLAICRIGQRICANPDIRILYAQRTKKEALKKCAAIVRLINQPKVYAAYGVRLVKEEDYWVVEGRSPHVVDPTLEAGGIDSELTGSHRDEIWLDDPVTWLSVRDPEQVLKTRSYFDLLQPLLDPMGVFVAILTPYAYGDLSHDIVHTMADEFEILLLDCGMTPKREPGKSPTLVGKPRFAHLTESYLLSRLKRMRFKNFMANYCLRIVNTEDETFTRQQFRSRSYTRAIAKSVRGFILTDTAVSDHRDSAYRVVAVCGLDSNDNAYLFDLRVGRWPSQMVPIHICDAYEKWTGEGLKIARVVMENITLNQNFRASIEQEAMRRGQRIRFEMTPRGKSQGSKDERIESLALRFEQGRFIVLSSVPPHFDDDADTRPLFDPEGWTENGVAMPAGELVEQFIRWPSYPFKDIPDALADLDVCDKDGARILRGAGIPPRLDVWSRTAHPLDQASQATDMKVAVRNLMTRIQSGGDVATPTPRRRRVAGERWRHLG